jgi:hypothetical protein
MVCVCVTLYTPITGDTAADVVGCRYDVAGLAVGFLTDLADDISSDISGKSNSSSSLTSIRLDLDGDFVISALFRFFPRSEGGSGREAYSFSHSVT